LKSAIGNYSIAGKRGQWPASEDTSLSYLTLPIVADDYSRQFRRHRRLLLPKSATSDYSHRNCMDRAFIRCKSGIFTNYRILIFSHSLTIS